MAANSVNQTFGYPKIKVMLIAFIKMNQKDYQLFLILALGLNLNLMSQSLSVADNIPDAGNVVEEIFLTTNRQLFADGETLWFSAVYSLNGQLKPKTQISNILYVTLNNCDDKVFSKQKYLIQSGVVNGKLNIPEDIPTGYYFLNAYTKYLRNFPIESFATIPVIVINQEAPTQHQINASVRVAAEYGGLIPEAENKLYISTGSYIANQARSIQLIALNGDTNISIGIYDNGLGSTTFIPEKNESYVLEVELDENRTIRDTLKFETITGPRLNLKRTDNEIVVIILNKELQAGQKERNYSISVLNEKLQTIAEPVFRKETYIPTEILHHHFNYFVLKSNKKIIDVMPYYHFPTIGASPDLELDSTGNDHNGNLGFRVDFSEQNTMEHACISVNLKGTSWSGFGNIPEIFIRNPRLLKSYSQSQGIFSDKLKNQIKIVAGLYRDYVNMPEFLTKIEQYNNPEIEHLPDIRDVSISGKILNKTNRQPVSGQGVYMSVLFDNPQLHIYETRSDGSFIFSGNDLFGSQTIYLGSGSGNSDTQRDIFIDVDFCNEGYGLKCAPLPEKIKTSPGLNQMIFNANITQAYDTGAYTMDDHIRCSSKYFGGRRLTIRPDDYIALESIKEVITELIGPLKIKRSGQLYNLKLLDEHDNLLPGNPMVLVDNIPVFDVNELLKIHPSKIEAIEIINKTYVYGAHAINGIIMLTTKTDNFAGVTLPDESVFLEYLMRNKNQHAANPATNLIEITSSTIPVFRNSLLWASTDSRTTGSMTYVFNRPDYSGSYQVIVKSYSSKGEFSVLVRDVR